MNSDINLDLNTENNQELTFAKLKIKKKLSINVFILILFIK